MTSTFAIYSDMNTSFRRHSTAYLRRLSSFEWHESCLCRWVFIFAKGDDLTVGIHSASLFEVVSAFGIGSSRRVSLALRLKRIYELARETRHLRRFVLFGSFVTRKVAPNDIDIFLIMENAFDVTRTEGHIRSVFDHATAQAEWDASVFWSRKGALDSSEEVFMAHLQIKRDGSRRGIVEIISE